MKIFNLFTITITCFFGIVVSNANPLPYKAIFNFGDSISDTGNLILLINRNLSNDYGSTYFNHSSGRSSDGRLIIDFIAEAYGLPFLPPYLNLTKDQDIKKGVNFAVANSGAIDDDYYVMNNISGPQANASLNVQLGWFKNLKPSLCKSKKDCKSLFKKSLFLVGEIGGNDIALPLWKHKTLTAEAPELVPLIIDSITKTTTALIKEGAVELVIPGNFPMGCNAAVMNTVKSYDIDQFGCYANINSLAEYFNEQLKSSIKTLRKKHPQAKITYFDYYNNLKRFFESPEEYGFDKKFIFKECLSKLGRCSDVSNRINWDGIHYTEAAYKLMAEGLLEGTFADPPLKSPPNKIA